MSKIEVDAIEPQSGTTLTVGASGDTITVPSGATFDASNATTTLPSTVVTTTGTQTLTNKTIDSDNNTITNIANAGIKAGAAIDYSKLNLTGNIALADLSATGTKDATTFLRGDNTFAAAGGGKVLQVVTATDSTERQTSSNSFVTASNTLTFNITPSATNSKILIFYNFSFHGTGDKSFTFYRDGSNLFDGTNGFRRMGGLFYLIGGSFVDEPNTTSQVTYELYFRANDSLLTSLNYDAYGSAQTGYLIGLEIGA